MKILTTFTLTMLIVAAPGQNSPSGDPDLQVIDFGWAQHVTSSTTNVMIVDDSANAPVSRREPRSSTLRTTVDERLERQRDTQTRMADLRSLEVLARASQVESVYGRTLRPYYEYYVRVKNTGGKQAQNVYWQYEFQYPDEKEPSIRQVYCKSKLKAEATKNLRLYSFQAPRKVIKVTPDGASELKSTDHVVINRIEYSDGSFWQRSGWKSELLSEEIIKRVGGGQCTTGF